MKLRYKLTTAAIAAFLLATINPMRAGDFLYPQAVAGQSVFGPNKVWTPLHIDSGVGDHFFPIARGASNDVRREGELRASFSTLPLSFEINRGQTNEEVKFLARAGGYLLFLTPTETVLALDNPAAHKNGKRNGDELLRTGHEPNPPRSIVRMKLVGANPAPPVGGLDELAGKSNYFGGSDPAQWRTGIPSYARVHYGQVYPGIDMVYYGSQRQLEYDFIVAAGADPAVVQFTFKGIESFAVDARGDLLLHTEAGKLRGRKPVAYQDKNGTRHEIPARHSQG